VEDPTILAEILQDTVDDEDPSSNDASGSALHFPEEDILDRCGVDDDLFASASPAGSSREEYVFPQNIASNLLATTFLVTSKRSCYIRVADEVGDETDGRGIQRDSTR